MCFTREDCLIWARSCSCDMNRSFFASSTYLQDYNTLIQRRTPDRLFAPPALNPPLLLLLLQILAQSSQMAALVGGEERVVATAQHILKSIRASKDITDDMLLILSTFDNRLSNISDLMNDCSLACEGGVNAAPRQTGFDPDIARFESAETVIFRYANNQFLWGGQSSGDVACEYLEAIDDVLLLMEDLRFQNNEEALDRAETVVQMAMSKLEEEFRNLLAGSTVPLDAERLYGSIRRVRLSFAENEGEGGIIDEFECIIDVREESEGRNRYYHERGRSLDGKEDVRLELINPNVIADLREIAERMIRAGYEKECCQVYSSVRKVALDDYLGTLGVDKLSIEEIQRVEWNVLDDKMKKWVQSIKIMMKKILECEKQLCEQVFNEWELIKEICFVETATGSVVQLLNFGEAVAIGNRSPEKLFRILDMYDALKDALPEFEKLFGDDSGEFLHREAQGVLDGLDEAFKGTFTEFEKAVKDEASKKPIHGAEIHPLARYVMNYAKLLVEYSETVNLLLESDLNEKENFDHTDGIQNIGEMSPLGRRLLSLISSLESNLEGKANQYEDGGLQCIFLMNNKLYILQKVKDSDLAKLLGDGWVRRRKGLIRKYTTQYLRASWSKALSCLRDEGIGGNGSIATSKMALKERFKSFNACFEEIYRIQTACKVPDSQLRTELRISISEKAIPAYKAFLGRFGNQLESGKKVGKYIKYSAEDIQGYVGDLFEGRPAVLHHARR